MRRVYVIEPHAVTREALCRLIHEAEGLRLGGSAPSLSRAAETLRAGEIDLVVVEPLVAVGDEAALLAAVQRAVPGAAILALTAIEKPARRAVFRLPGSVDFVSKREPISSILDAMRSAPRP